MTADAEGREGDRGPGMWWGRLARALPQGRRALLAAGLAGLLIGAGTVAWWEEAGPFQDGSARSCWDSLTGADLPLRADREKWGEAQDVRAEEVAPLRSSPTGHCRITDGWNTLRVRVHQPSSWQAEIKPVAADSWPWTLTHVTSDMTWLGGELRGMASSTRAWLALPASCVSPTAWDGPVIVDISIGGEEIRGADEEYRTVRDSLARTVTRVANGTMRELGCDGEFPLPEDLPDPIAGERVSPERLCGIEGLALPEEYQERFVYERAGHDGGPARSCELSTPVLGEAVRLTTIEDPGIARSLRGAEHGLGEMVVADQGYDRGRGEIGPRLALFHARCQTGDVTFAMHHVIQTREHRGLTREVFADYVEAEAERIGCGPLTIRPAD